MAGQLGTNGATLGASFQLGTGAAAAPDPLNKNVAQSVGFVQTLGLDLVVSRTTSNAIGLTAGETITSNYIILAASNGLSLAGVSGPNATIDVIQYLGFTPRTLLDASNLIGLSAQRVAEATSVDAVNALFQVTGGPTVLWVHPASNDLALIVSALPIFEHTASNDLDLTGTASSAATNPSRDFTQSVISQHVSYTISDTKCREREYAPETGSVTRRSGGEPANLPLGLPPAPTFSTGTLTLTHPYETPTLTLTLKSPEYGDTDSVSFQRIDRQTMGGDRKLFSDPAWGNWETLELRVERIDCEATIDEIITFLNTSLGEEIGLLDWDGQQWRGKILTPDSDITKQVSGWNVTIRFEGVVTENPVTHNAIQVLHNGEIVTHVS
jgi:hypothetical protein